MTSNNKKQSSDWLNVTKKILPILEKPNENDVKPPDPYKLGVAFIQDKYNSGILNSYFNMMDTVSSGYYTILNIENRNMPTEFCELIYKNIHYDYHISNEYLDGDDQLSNDSGDDSEFTQVKSKFVYE